MSDAHQVAKDIAGVIEMLKNGYEFTAVEFSKLGFEKRLAVDALYHRYTSLVSILQDRVFISIAVVEQEDVAQSRRGLTELMEKLGVINDADTFSRCAIARNEIAHTYKSEPREQAGRLNLALLYGSHLVRAFNNALEYVVKRRLLPIAPLAGLDQVAIDFPESAPTSSPK
jgi:hypothetical protein